MRICRAGLKTVAGYYQYREHLGSSVIECNEHGQVISYEEYHPYGRSAYRAAASGVDLSLKRYRFTGKERDEETGLDYFGVRYYASWLGRWTSGDPGGFVDGLNLYRYVRNNPVNGIDKKGYQTDPPPDDCPDCLKDPSGNPMVLPAGAVVTSSYSGEARTLPSGIEINPSAGSPQKFLTPTKGGGWIPNIATYEEGKFIGYSQKAEVSDALADELAYQVSLGIQRQKFNDIFVETQLNTQRAGFNLTMAMGQAALNFVGPGLAAGAFRLAAASFMARHGAKLLAFSSGTSLAAKTVSYSGKFVSGVAGTLGYEMAGSYIANTGKYIAGYETDVMGDIDLFDAALGGFTNTLRIPMVARAGIDLVGGVAVDYNSNDKLVLYTDKDKEQRLIEIGAGLMGVGTKHIAYKDFDSRGEITLSHVRNSYLESFSYRGNKVREMADEFAKARLKSMNRLNMGGEFLIKGVEIPMKSAVSIFKEEQKKK